MANIAPELLAALDTIEAIEKTKAKIRQTLGELPDCWNGYGAEPISPAIIEAAIRFLDGLPDDVPFLMPQVVPMTGGRLQLEWNGDKRSLELEFATPSEIHYLTVAEYQFPFEATLVLPNQSRDAYEAIRWVAETPPDTADVIE